MAFMGKSEYDRDVGTWSPEGRLFQIEYALEAIKFGSTALGLISKEGVVLAVEKKITNPLIVPSSIEKIFEIDSHMGCAMSGLAADARTLVDHARNEVQNHWFTYNEKMSVESCVKAISDLALDFSDVRENRRRVMARPFGVSLMVAGVNDGVPCLWVTDPSGSYRQYTAAAIGSAQEGATALLKEQYRPDLTLKEAENLALVILRQMMEEKMTNTNVEIVSIENATGQYKLYSTADIDRVMNDLPPPTLGV